MAAAAPTGCYKCGRPGHWSRDCPSAPASASASADPADANPKPGASRFAPYPNARPRSTAAAEGDGSGTAQKTKKKEERATRPKLTPDLLLSDDGVGFVLRYFPKVFNFKPRGRPGHEICISELRDRVSRGGDPTKLYEPQVEEAMPTGEPADGTAPEDPVLGTEAPFSGNHGTDSLAEDIHPPVENYDMDPMQEDLLDQIYEKEAHEPQIPAEAGTTTEASQPSASKEVSLRDDPPSEVQKPQDGGGSASTSSNRAKIELSEAQKARMEANRLRALERAAARGHASAYIDPFARC